MLRHSVRCNATVDATTHLVLNGLAFHLSQSSHVSRYIRNQPEQDL